MEVPSGTNQELIEEISTLKQKIKELEQSEAELRRAQESLHESAARIREIVDNAPFGAHLYRLDPEQRLVFVGANRAADLILRVNNQQFVGKTIEEAFPALRKTPIPDAYRRAAATGERYETEQVVYAERGVRGVYEVHALQIASNRMVAFFRDITERKKAEEEQEKLRTQLVQAQKMESVGRLAGGVAHDFNNMLSVILGYTELSLGQIAATDPLHANLREIQKAALSSADLTRQLLAFARKQPAEPKILNMDETVTGLLKMLRRLIGESISLVWKPDKDLWLVRMDPSQIDQILVNLCVNARDAIAEVGQVVIETANVVFDEAQSSAHNVVPGDYVELAVSDSGHGMEMEVLDHLFEPFFTTKETGRGTGLGLATVYGIVKQNEGFIKTYSEPDNGTTFKIYLPRHTGMIKQARSDSPSRETSTGHETLLLVEDEPAILNLSKILLEKLGYRVLAAATPDEAIRLTQGYTGEISLLMTDVVMPEMNGRELSQKLLPLYPKLKCLFVSGYTADVIAHHGVLDEGINFIQKPFSIQALAAKVREVLDGG